MITEIIILALATSIAAVGGYMVAKRAFARYREQQLNRLSASYFRGLNYLLNEQQDKAIEVFLEIAEVDPDTVETHLAIGNLFRRRGEVDRAIRFHQNLIARENLEPHQRTLALLELGEDFMRAGLLDRAEALFTDLIDIDAHTPSALSHLIQIYQQEKDWTSAIAQAERMEKVGGQSMRTEIAQYHCEIATQRWADGHSTEAMDRLDRALATDPQCVRANLLRGKYAMAERDCAAAIEAFETVLKQDLDYVGDVLQSLRACYERKGDLPGYRAVLEEIVARYRGVTPVLALAELIAEQEGDAAAAEFLSQQMHRRPSVRGIKAMIELNLQRSRGKAKDDLQILRDLTLRLLRNAAIYRCNHCGFSGRTHHWQCPSCKRWTTIKPIHGVAAE